LDDLEIDVPILNLINLAGIGNHYLNQLPKPIYDTQKLVVAVPVIDVTFHVAAVTLPNKVGAIVVEVDVAKVTRLGPQVTARRGKKRLAARR
jgi:hypothetical protein